MSELAVKIPLKYYPKHNAECVYFLVSDNRTCFKIGVSTNTRNRIKTLKDSFDSCLSFKILCNPGCSFVIEKILHRMFRGHSTQKPKKDGSTEWFDIDCFDLVQDLLISHKDKLGWYTASHIPRKSHTENILPLFGVELKGTLSEQTLKQVAIDSDLLNRPIVDMFEQLIIDMSTKGYLAGMIDLGERFFGTSCGTAMLLIGHGFSYAKYVEPIIKANHHVLRWNGFRPAHIVCGDIRHRTNESENIGLCLVEFKLLWGAFCRIYEAPDYVESVIRLRKLLSDIPLREVDSELTLLAEKVMQGEVFEF